MEEEILTVFFDWKEKHTSYQAVRSLNQNKFRRDLNHHS